MRLVAGTGLIDGAASNLMSGPHILIAIASVLLLSCGILLIAGLWTPLAGSLVALIELGKIVALPADRWIYLYLATLGVSLAMLGPGLWSVDARLFGWKRIEPPPQGTET